MVAHCTMSFANREPAATCNAGSAHGFGRAVRRYVDCLNPRCKFFQYECDIPGLAAYYESYASCAKRLLLIIHINFG